MSEAPLAGRLAVVTGALGRLGPVWVRALASAGADVVGLDLSDDGAEQLRESVADGPGSYSHHLTDVCVREELDEVCEAMQASRGAASILVCSAGIDQSPDASADTARIEDVPAAAFRETLDVNLVGTFLSIQAFGQPMADAGGGSIVTIGSLYASQAPDPALYDHLDVDPPFLKPPAYGASKAGVVSLTRYFARLWGPYGVRVNALSPGGVRGDQDSEFVRKYSARVPLGRLAEPEELAGPLVFLASDASSYLSGRELVVDGGLSA